MVEEDELVGGTRVSMLGAKMEEMVWYLLVWRREEGQSVRDESD